MSHQSYCTSLYQYSRFLTREVKIGNLKMGGSQPIRLQSMTTTDTMNTKATVEQSIRMIEAGCELVRITAPSKDEAENLLNIKNELRKLGYETPLVADIHFTPNAAEIAASIVEKVRVNPGNYADKKKFEELSYTEESYSAELDRIKKRFSPLVLLCKQHGAAMRIGTNHGSLSDRILSHYGDTPMGMVESAMEFVRICRENDYHELVISMKASNPQVMIQAYRLLVSRMTEEGMNYPLHLGVTEAGDGLDGRIKSAVGIGTLLEDGIGDTIRVSLTEEPEAEIPVAKLLADRYDHRGNEQIVNPEPSAINPFEYRRRNTRTVRDFGGKNVPRVISDYSQLPEITPASLFSAGYIYSVPLDKWNIRDQAADYLFCGDNKVNFEIPGTLGLIYNYPTWKKNEGQLRSFPLLDIAELISIDGELDNLYFVKVSTTELNNDLIERLAQAKNAVIVLQTNHDHAMADQRNSFFRIINRHNDLPVVLLRSYENIYEDQFMLYSSTDLGGLLIDGLGDGIWIETDSKIPRQKITETAFGILQATRTRISKTEYISCPSCGRTLVDLQETTSRIRSRTSHLKGVKIGIMGCIVNGPGEMADADYGYVGTGPGKITLYKEKEVVKRNVPEAEAVDELIALIREHGDWIELPEHMEHY
ncbi:MAG: (E)-4-hydroxy-3-methylbut-2-enyl-diphosphate synthase [Flavobacteriales bacterium]|nr:(E)-4-hydroxy-3-methylbut-2-enyl-diphosphate synthase [Flavobacteriales bacterium]